jgi:hypothetical protein
LLQEPISLHRYLPLLFPPPPEAPALQVPSRRERGATTITRLARNDQKAASALSLDLAGKVVTVLDCGIEDLLEVVEE